LALPDFEIFQKLAEAWGGDFPWQRWSSPAAAFQILKQLSAGQPFDFTAIHDYAQLEASGGIQWPMAEAHAEKERRLFGDGRFYHADGKARFVYKASRPPKEELDRDFPFILLTGRGSSAQWHTETRTKESPILGKLHSPFLFLTMNPGDAKRLALQNGQKVEVRSKRGALQAYLELSMNLQRGQVFLPMHHPAVNQLTCEEVDPQSRQPSYKYCAVAVRCLEFC
jgi:assimilatory nitrate reductase catalytic subunit